MADDPRRGTRQTPSMAFIYFVFGFFLAAAVSMVVLVLLRPALMADSTPGVLRLAMWSPVALGLIYGGRVAYLGMKHDLGLSTALKRGLMFWRL